MRYWDIQKLRYWDIKIFRYRDIEILKYWDIEILRYWDIENLSQVNKRFNPVKVLPKASHCQSEFKVHMVLHDLFFSFMLFMSQAYSSKQLKGPTHLQPYCFFGICRVGLHPVWLYPLSGTCCWFPIRGVQYFLT